MGEYCGKRREKKVRSDIRYTKSIKTILKIIGMELENNVEKEEIIRYVEIFKFSSLYESNGKSWLPYNMTRH